MSGDRFAGMTREEKLALLAKLAKKKAAKEPKAHPQSFAQQRLWFLHQLDPDSYAQNMFRAFVLEGPLDSATLTAALRRVVRRHGSLRTTFGGGEEPQQIVAPAAAADQFQVPVIELPEGPGDAEQRLRALAEAEARKPFDLSSSLFRVTLVRLSDQDRSDQDHGDQDHGEQRHGLLLALHHIIADGWSMGILLREFATCFVALSAGQEPELPSLPIQYSDFSRWQNEQLDLEEQLQFWRRELAGAPTILELPGDHPRPAVASLQGNIQTFALEAELAEGLRQLARSSGATIFMVLTAAFNVLLYRFSGQDDLLLGTPIANRNRNETEALIGSFANTLVLRARLGGRPTFRQQLEQVKKHAIAAYDHQDLPFERLVEELQPERDLSRNPLFQVMFALVDAQKGGGAAGKLGGLDMRPFPLGRGLSKVDLTLEMIAGEHIQGYFEYSTDLFEAATIRRLCEAFVTLLEAIVEDPDQVIDDLPLLEDAEKQNILHGWNQTATEFDLETPLHHHLRRRAEQTPEAIAVEAWPAVSSQDAAPTPQRLSYGELHQRARRLARRLRDLGAAPGGRVGIAMERSPEAMTAFLAVLETGAAYVPLDPSYPRERLAYLVEDSAIEVLLTQEHLAELLPRVATTLLLDRDWQELTDAGDESPLEVESEVPVTADDIAYVIYTSGSTGKPKGVLIPHRAVVNHGHAIITRYGLEAADRVLQFASLSFDIAVEEIYPSWLAGATLVLRPEAQSLAFGDFLRLLDLAGVTVANLPTPYWHEWVSDLAEGGSNVPAALRLVIVGTEQALPERLGSWLKTVGDHPKWINAYGPSETTVSATAWDAPPSRGESEAGESEAGESGETADIHSAPIGKPLANVRSYVLDKYLQPLPLGVPGQLVIGGPGLARGYSGRPALTAEKFIPDPFADSGQRLYASGDRVRWLDGGDIEFLGRVDRQVKIRGFRIEVGEIEATLAQHEAVKENVVEAIEAGQGDRRLVAYVSSDAPHAGLDEELRQHLADQLPAYMVPTAFVLLESLPLTLSGKVDRRALPAPQWQSQELEEATQPRSPQEEIVASIWREVLGRDQLGIHDNFFELGGHSLLATRMLSRIRSTLDIDLPLRDVFEAPTVAQLAARLDDARREGDPPPPMVPIGRQTAPELSFAQQRMWFLTQLDPGSHAYNMPAALEMVGPLDVDCLQRAFEHLFARHESLRTTFRAERGEPRQVITEQVEVLLPLRDLRDPGGSGQGDEDLRQAALEATREESKQPFDLASQVPLRLLLLRLTDEHHWLVFTFHHIVSDGWSTDVFLRELIVLYHAMRKDQPDPLAPLPIQYADYAAWQRNWLRGEVLEGQLDFWRQQLAGAPTVLDLPTDRPRPTVQRFLGDRASFQVDAETASALEGLGQRVGSSPFMIYLAAFGALLQRYGHQDDLLIGTPIAGRQQAETEGLIGYFANTLVLRMDLTGAPSFEQFLGRVRGRVLDAYAHQDLPFEQMVDELKIERDLSHTPLFQAVFVLHHAARVMAGGSQSELKMHLPSIDNQTSRFDLNLVLVEQADGYRGFLEYNSDLFDPSTAEAMATNYRGLLEAVATDPAQVVTHLPMVRDSAASRVASQNFALPTPLDGAQTLHGRFSRHAAAHGDRIAVVYEDATLTYADLEGRANQVAHALIERGVGAETRVALCLERNVDLVVAILGVLKAGGGYVPIDPSSPTDRRRFIIEDCGAPVLLTRQSLLAEIETNAEILTFEALEKQAYSDEAPGERSGAEHLAYVIYTSGSTGVPKGVSITHRNVLRLFDATEPWFTPGPDDVWSLFHSFAFDFSVWELWGALLYGGRVVVVPYWVSRSAEAFYDLLVSSHVTCLSQTPSMFRLVDQVDAERSEGKGKSPLEDLRLVVFGGEALDLHSLAPWWQRHAADAPRLVNMYGITETTVHVTYLPLAPELLEQSMQSLIGEPIPDLETHLFDRHLKPVALGAAGEICVGGDGLARGYMARPSLTAQRFVPHPLADRPGARLYRSGDLGRRLPVNSELDYLGRIDHQVKIRGFRIELGEIEARLAEQPSIRECVLLAREDSPGDQRLAAYMVLQDAKADSGKTIKELRDALGKTLPEYMVPTAWVVLEALPLTNNGKIDRRALPVPEQDRSIMATEYLAPRTPVEEKLVAIWQEVLKVERVGALDNFFELGGHSLLATQAMARTTESFDIELPLRTLFEAPTVAGLAEEIMSREVAQTDDDLLAQLLEDL